MSKHIPVRNLPDDQFRAYNRERQRAYYRTPEGRAAIARGVRAYDRRHPEARRAWTITNRAVQSGEILKPEHCDKCLRKARLDAHHPDHARPLAVRWLCRACHVAAHGRGRGRKVSKAK